MNSFLWFIPEILLGQFPCGFIIFMEIFIVPLICGAIEARLMTLYYLSKFSHQAARNAMESMASTGYAYEGLEEDESRSNSAGFQSGRYCKCRPLDRMVELRFGFYSMVFASVSDPKTEKDRTRLIRALWFITSPWGVISISFFILLPFIVIGFVILAANREYMSCYGCTNDLNATLLESVVGVGATTIVAMLFFWFRVLYLDDSWGLRSESTYCIVIAVLCLAIAVCEGLVDIPADSTFQFPFVLQILLCTLVIVNTLLQLYLGYRETSVTSRVVSSDRRDLQIGLTEVLADKVLAEAFEKHLVNELGIESLLFIRDAENWKAVYYDIAPTARRARAKKIYETYISTNGMFSVNIPETILLDVRKTIQATHTRDDLVPMTIFDAAIQELRNLLTIGALKRFLNSSAFEELGRSKMKTTTTSMKPSSNSTQREENLSAHVGDVQ